MMTPSWMQTPSLHAFTLKCGRGRPRPPHTTTDDDARMWGMDDDDNTLVDTDAFPPRPGLKALRFGMVNSPV